MEEETILEPIECYRCPKSNQLITDDVCKSCKFYVKSRWYNHKWCVICRYKREDEQH
ncbi:MAG: hypothetical protein ACP5KW_11995 [Thermoproteota archaeon]